MSHLKNFVTIHYKYTIACNSCSSLFKFAETHLKQSMTNFEVDNTTTQLYNWYNKNKDTLMFQNMLQLQKSSPGSIQENGYLIPRCL